MSDKGQRTEKQTAKRRKESRRKGQVARSPILVPWATLLVITMVLPPLLGGVADALSESVRSVKDVIADPSTTTMLEIGRRSFVMVFAAMIPFFVVIVLISIAGSLSQVGFILTFGPLTPKAERVNPAKGLKRIFSTRSLWEALKQVALVAVIALVSYPAVRGLTDELGATVWPLEVGVSMVGDDLVSLLRLVAFIGTVAGLADYGWQRWTLVREGRMTKEEVKREHRESEGDPHVKSKLRSLRAAMSRNQVLAAVGQADVVITNPTHVAVALRYEATIGPPRVVARGADAAAARIRTRAAEASVPVVESPPLARSLYAACRTDEEIPAQMFQAVATVLAFVHRLERRTVPGGSLTLFVPDTWTPPGRRPDEGPVRVRPARRRRSLTQVSSLPIHPGRSAVARSAAGRSEHGRPSLSMDT